MVNLCESLGFDEEDAVRMKLSSKSNQGPFPCSSASPGCLWGRPCRAETESGLHGGCTMRLASHCAVRRHQGQYETGSTHRHIMKYFELLCFFLSQTPCSLLSDTLKYFVSCAWCLAECSVDITEILNIKSVNQGMLSIFWLFLFVPCGRYLFGFLEGWQGGGANREVPWGQSLLCALPLSSRCHGVSIDLFNLSLLCYLYFFHILRYIILMSCVLDDIILCPLFPYYVSFFFLHITYSNVSVVRWLRPLRAFPMWRSHIAFLLSSLAEESS